MRGEGIILILCQLYLMNQWLILAFSEVGWLGVRERVLLLVNGDCGDETGFIGKKRQREGGRIDDDAGICRIEKKKKKKEKKEKPLL